MNAPETTRPVVVGIDGSTPSEVARDWAATVAAAERLRLVLLTAVSPPIPESGAWFAAHISDHDQMPVQLEERAGALFRRSAAQVRETYPDLDIQHDLRFADPRDALLETDADLIVVGTHGLGPVRRLLVGSVASTVVKHATCPTVVVRAGEQSGASDSVIVGIAGDTGDAAASDLAFRIAAARGLPVTALHSVWDVVGLDETREVPSNDPDYEAQRLLLSDPLDPAVRRHPEVEVQQRISRGFADERLIDASHNADLLVVGHRRRTFLNELIYGSVAPRVVEHATCSVAVVPYEEPGDQATGSSPGL